MAFHNADSSKQRSSPTTAIEMFLRHTTFIKDTIRLYVRDENEVDDLFQNIFIFVACRPLPSQIRDVKAYLYTVITNAIFNSIRDKKKYRNCIHAYLKHIDHSPSAEETPEEILSEAEKVRKLFELIKKHLPRTEAQAVTYQYGEGLNAKEMAKKMNVSSSTVRGYVSGGLSRIRRLLEKIEI